MIHKYLLTPLATTNLIMLTLYSVTFAGGADLPLADDMKVLSVVLDRRQQCIGPQLLGRSFQKTRNFTASIVS